MHNMPALIQGGLGEVWRLAPQSSLLIKELLQRLGVTAIDWYYYDDGGGGGGGDGVCVCVDTRQDGILSRAGLWGRSSVWP